ncbi:histidine phosphatase family protein [Paenibacillus sp. GCM10027626]|uniref:histidine phosphatase family protein n=1 Tax=Paenibacillus sp. GCM10027626 TaxID=3273411 RepID=UPI003630CC83
MLTNLYFVRHAHSIYTADELNRPLSEHGQEGARKVAKALKNENVNVFISSPYKRAIQTIEGLAEIMSADILIEKDFRERLLSGKPIDDFETAIAKVWEDFSFKWEGGESSNAAQNRGVRALEKTLQRFAGENIVVGTHGNLMALIMNSFDRKFDFAFWRQLDMPDIYKLSFDYLKLTGVKRIHMPIEEEA